MNKIFGILVFLLPIFCFAKDNRPPLGEHPTEYHQGNLYFTPRGSRESTYYGTIVGKTEYHADWQTWSSTTLVRSVDKEPETHTLHYRYNPKTHRAEITNDDASILGHAKIIGSLSDLKEVMTKITVDQGNAKVIIDTHETIHEGVISLTENLFLNIESEASLIGTLQGTLYPISKEHFESLRL